VNTTRIFALACAVDMVLLAGVARAQTACGEWTPGVLPLDGVSAAGGGAVQAFATFDDGTGPALYVAGSFQIAGKIVANNIAKWTGQGWDPLGSGTSDPAVASFGRIQSLVVFDDGTGPALFAGGWFDVAGGVSVSRLAKWNGSEWSDVGGGVGEPGAQVDALAVFDDGRGPALYVAGDFQSAGGISASQIARWDGHQWSNLRSGLQANFGTRALAVFDDGTGPALYAGGEFEHSGTIALSHVARWNGTDWSSLGSGITDCCSSASVNALAVWDDGSGPALFAAGVFPAAGGASQARNIAKWNGTSWSALGTGLGVGAGEPVNALAIFDDGTGPALIAAGKFVTAGGGPASRIAKWNGSSWSALGNGLSDGIEYGQALTTFDDGAGSKLFVGGGFHAAGDGFFENVARWDGATWSRLDPGTPAHELLYPVNVFRTFDDGTGPALYIGSDSYSSTAPLVPKHALVSWTGSVWTELPRVEDKVRALEVFDDGSGPALYVGGDFSAAGGIITDHVARWDGASFAAVGAGLNGSVHSLRVFDDGTGPALYAGGEFTAAGGVSANRIARWNGMSWSPLAAGIPGSTSFADSVDALEAFGGELYAGGQFFAARGAPADGLAKWDGTAWSSIGTGVDGPVYALESFDEGRGPALFAGGAFTQAGSAAAWFVARWDGTSWSPLGEGVNVDRQGVLALEAFDDGTGPALYVGGGFTDASGVAAANNVARWNGSAWSALGAGTEEFGVVRALAGFDDGSGAALYAGGFFLHASGGVAVSVSRWSVSPALPARGNVNAAAARPTDVLFVNGSAGDSSRTVEVVAGVPFELRLDHAPNGPRVAPFVLWAWAGSSARPVELLHGDGRIGCLVNPTPIEPGLRPQPLACLRSATIPARACRGVAERSGPANAPFTVQVTRGLRPSTSLVFQGLLRDDLSIDPSGFSVTNATTVMAR
jgi:hypothetical protein